MFTIPCYHVTMSRHGAQPKLLDVGTTLPNGLVYRPDFITPNEEDVLLAHIENLPLVHPIYEEEYAAKRRVKGFGWKYDFEKKKLIPGRPLPSFLALHARKIAKWMDIPASRVVHALITEYTPGTSIAWHTDTEEFAHVIGISLAGWCRMRFRPIPWLKSPPASLRGVTRDAHRIYNTPRSLAPSRLASDDFSSRLTTDRKSKIISLELEPRSAYIMQGPVRWQWQHSVAATRALRYSITFRTLP
jgi:alkylated DNA repair dioxygenase AlkB